MSIFLPDSPGLKNAKHRLLDWGGRLVPTLGGPVQTLTRLGTRSSVEYTLPSMPSEPDGRIWGMTLRQAKISGVIAPFLQDGLIVGTPGAIVVDGQGQSGTSLRIRGGAPGYVIRFGQAFSIVHGGRRYLYFAAQQIALDTNGKALLPIFPMLRAITSDGDICEFSRPLIEGSLTGNEVAWDVQTAPWTDIGTIRIDEDA